MLMNNIIYSTLKIPVRYLVSNASKVVAVKLKKQTDVGFKKKRIADRVRIYVRGGSGGQGAPSTGGIGGNGGNIYIKCAKGGSLSNFIRKSNRRIIAGHGRHSKRSNLKVIHGEDVYIVVPPGTEVKSGEGVLLRDLDEDGQIYKIANGGTGGSARYEGFNGQKGERKNIVLELKSIADVALTGFPNAGKSSLLRVLSRARPKVGDYPFTTINPMVGSIFYSDNTQVKVVDLPGLIEEAHLNKGMGHRFLRHIERTKVIMLVIDVNGFQLNPNEPFRTAFDTVLLLLKELALYQGLLLKRPSFLVLNKMDGNNSQQKADEMLNQLTKLDVNHEHLIEHKLSEEILNNIKLLIANDCQNILFTSAKLEQGLEVLKEKLYDSLPQELYDMSFNEDDREIPC